MLLENKVATITGGGRGIGRAIAMQFAHEGADVALMARSTRQINEVADEIRNLGRNALAITTDITNRKDVSNTFDKIQSDFSQIDILVNNAGVEFKTPFIEMKLDEWDRTMAVNTSGTVICTKEVLPGMIKRNEGCIINIASGAGLRGLPGSAAYSASKAAIIALSFSIADELRDHGIRVNVICPGPIETDMLDRNILAQKKSKVLQPDDVASTAVFLASELSGEITGQIFSVRNTNRW